VKSDFVRRTGEVSIAEQSKVDCEMPGLFALAHVFFRVTLCESGRTTLQNHQYDRCESNEYDMALHFFFCADRGSESHSFRHLSSAYRKRAVADRQDMGSSVHISGSLP